MGRNERVTLCLSHGELQILEHFLGFREVMIRSAGGGEFDSKFGDHRETVPFSCRLEDATSGNKQQLEATRSNWKQQGATRNVQRRKRLGNKQQQQAATPGNRQQLDRNPAVRHNGCHRFCVGRSVDGRLRGPRSWVGGLLGGS